MADQDLSPDPLAPAPDDEGGRMLVGILGDSGNADTVRLYLDLEFSKSYDIAKDAIIRREKLSADQSPLGVESSAVWVKHGTVLQLREAKARKVEDEFLAGDFTEAGTFAPGATAQPILSHTPNCGIVPPSLVAICPTNLVRCQSRLTCPSVATICITRIKPCGVSQQFRCPSVIDACPTRICKSVVACQSVLTCPSQVGCPSELGCPSDFCGGFEGRGGGEI